MVERCEIDLLVDLRQNRLHEHVTFAFARLPNICEVVDALTPLVYEKRRWLGVGRFDPGWEQTTLVCLEEQELIEVSVRDLLDGLDVVARDELVVGVEELCEKNSAVQNRQKSRLYTPMPTSLNVCWVSNNRLIRERPIMRNRSQYKSDEVIRNQQTLVRVVVSLLDQRKLFALRLVQAPLDAVRLLELLEREDKQLGVVLVRQRAIKNKRCKRSTHKR